MKKIFAYLLWVLLLQPIMFSSAQDERKPIGKLLNGFENYVSKSMEDWKVPGVAVAIVRDSSIVFVKGFGYRDMEKKLPVTEKTLFAIGSCTKAFTAVAVGELVDEGQIELNKPVRTYIPSFKMYDDYISEHITPRDLMCHRSGLPRHDMVWYGTDLSRKELMKTLQYLEPSKGFRETFQYQNLMFMAAGVLVETLSGLSWEQYVKKNILGPLEMKTSDFSVKDMQQTNDFSFPYSKREENVTQIPFRNIDAIGPAGSINSNIIEMSNWLIMQINGGKFKGQTIISESFLKESHTPQMIASGGMSDEVFYQSYGLGWFITSYRGHLRIEHGGGIDGFVSSVCLLPKDSIGIVILTNYDNAQITAVIRNTIIDRMLELEEIDWHQRLFEQYKKSQEDQEKVKAEDVSRMKDTEPSHPLKDYQGTYENPAYGTFKIKLSDGHLVAARKPFEYRLEHYHLDIFEADDPITGKQKFVFHYNLKGEINKLTMNLQEGVSYIEFTRQPEMKELERSDLEKYVGEYDFGSGATAKVYIKGDKTLMAFIPGQPEYELLPVKEHVFELKSLKGYRFIFNVNKKGIVFELISDQPNGSFRAVKK
jgi:CubicO group peptidase (beta-lactamase class C family)